jgi:hypothetical protein
MKLDGEGAAVRDVTHGPAQVPARVVWLCNPRLRGAARDHQSDDQDESSHWLLDANAVDALSAIVRVQSYRKRVMNPACRWLIELSKAPIALAFFAPT